MSRASRNTLQLRIYALYAQIVTELELDDEVSSPRFMHRLNDGMNTADTAAPQAPPSG